MYPNEDLSKESSNKSLQKMSERMSSKGRNHDKDNFMIPNFDKSNQFDSRSNFNGGETNRSAANPVMN